MFTKNPTKPIATKPKAVLVVILLNSAEQAVEHSQQDRSE